MNKIGFQSKSSFKKPKDQKKRSSIRYMKRREIVVAQSPKGIHRKFFGDDEVPTLSNRNCIINPTTIIENVPVASAQVPCGINAQTNTDETELDVTNTKKVNKNYGCLKVICYQQRAEQWWCYRHWPLMLGVLMLLILAAIIICHIYATITYGRNKEKTGICEDNYRINTTKY